MGGIYLIIWVGKKLNRNDYIANKKLERFNPPIRSGQIWRSVDYLDFDVVKARIEIRIVNRNPFSKNWGCEVIEQFTKEPHGKIEAFDFVNLSDSDIYDNFEIETVQREVFKTPHIDPEPDDIPF